ncbi:MAG: glycosyltransferase family 39 protein [Solirubrobacteraceae bacterium]
MTAAELAAGRGVRLVISRRVVIGTALAAISATAVALRFQGFAAVPANPYYDAAVRSMSGSWRNFFFGAFEPGGSVSIDKPPLDLWLQVASVKLLGFSSPALRMPEALASAAAVPLLFDTVRRLFGSAAGLASAAALAVLPAAILTGRSDTMDSVMMLLVVLAAWLTVRAAASGRRAPLIWAGAALGLAFNVKLFQALIPVPALAALFWLGSSRPARERAGDVALGGAAFAATAAAWLAAASLAPGATPYPIGSTNGSVWNVVFGFNGIDRLLVGGPAEIAAADPAGPGRLFHASGVPYGALIGTMLLPALILGGLALAAWAWPGRPAGLLGRSDRLARAGGVAIAAWLGTGLLLFSAMGRIHPRYLEAITPAAAAAAGASAVALATLAARRRAAAAALAAGTLAVAALVPAVGGPRPPVAALALAAAGVTVAAGAAAAALRPGAARRGAAAVAGAAALAAVLCVPVATAGQIARGHAEDSGRFGQMAPARVARFSGFLRAHQGAARYEFASITPAYAGPLIVRDGRPVLMLTTLYSRPHVTSAQLAAAVRSGQVRYALLGPRRGAFGPRSRVPAVRWAWAHAHDISRRAGFPHAGQLSLLMPWIRRS